MAAPGALLCCCYAEGPRLGARRLPALVRGVWRGALGQAAAGAPMGGGLMMAGTVFDSAIFRDSFATPAMRDIFSEPATVARYVEVEVALAQVEARLGIIPQDQADTIKRLAS